MTPNVYVFSGLGADERVFQKINFGEHTPCFIQWIEPLHNEPIASYAQRLLVQIQDEKPILIGLSFGGVMAVEVAKLLDYEKIILISSVKTCRELPLYYRWIGTLNLHKLVPTSLLKKQTWFTNYFFGVENNTDKQLLGQILNDTSSTFLRWAIDALVSWQHQFILPRCYHIHGTTDWLLPVRFVTADCALENGGHLMVLNKAEAVSRYLIKTIRL